MLKIHSWLALVVVGYGFLIMIYGIAGYILPYILADGWAGIIQAGLSSNSSDSYRVARILAEDAFSYKLPIILLGAILAFVGVLDNFRHGYLKRAHAETAPAQ
jgi:hypothetical protein